MEKTYLRQDGGSTCVAISITNACRYLGLQEPSMEMLIDRLKCRHGDALCPDKVISDIFGDRMVKVKSFDTFMGAGGILTIMHPIYNLHSTFCYPDEEGFTWINSWLGPNIMKHIGKEEIAKFLPHKNNQGFWKMQV